MTQIKPFVKWAGGKSQLLSELKNRVPKSYSRYIEPFIGGGALLFELSPKMAIINDSNIELTNTYEIIKKYPDKLILDLKKHKNEEEYFYKIRALKSESLNPISRASRLLYLNRTCFNGLWRVNQKNEFNTPFGNYENPKILNEELLLEVSNFLQNVEIYGEDFEEFLLEVSKKGDFIYLDPPYHPVSKYSDFNRYTKKSFKEEEQNKLANLFKKLDKRGCKLLQSNSNSEFIKELYKEYIIEEVYAKRNINKDSTKRGAIKELLIRNYE